MITDWIAVVRDGARFHYQYEEGIAQARWRECGVLPLVSGAFVLEDIDWVRDGASYGDLHVDLEPGMWPIRMAVLEFANNVKLPLLCMFGSPHAVTSWKPADGRQPFVDCDRGVVCAFDLVTRPRFASDLLADDDTYFAMMDQAAQDDFSVVLDHDHVAVFTFYCGPGSDQYPVWLGQDESGRTVCVVVDSLVMRDCQPV
jgi:hypothetical protein